MFCHRTQEFLAERGIEIENRDVTKDPQALEELKQLGYATTPVTVIDGEVIIGFDQSKLERLLGTVWGTSPDTGGVMDMRIISLTDLVKQGYLP